ncbi:hypothetical protein Q0P14_14900, partial [Staphylococcus aureus]|nr:hypothetical protein [Staphylococcus aureus]
MLAVQTNFAVKEGWFTQRRRGKARRKEEEMSAAAPQVFPFSASRFFSASLRETQKLKPSAC